MSVARCRVLAWQDIPVLVEARDDTDVVTLPLSERFQALVDAVAMQQGLAGSDAYLEHWAHLPLDERAGSARDAATAVAAELEGRFDEYSSRMRAGG